MSEAKVLRDIMLNCGHDTTLFRNQVGQYKLADGRFLRSGLCVGSSDLVGDKSIVITPDMVGLRIAVAVYIEAKDEKGRATKEQLNFIEQAKKRGALAGIARSAEDAEKILCQLG